MLGLGLGLGLGLEPSGLGLGLGLSGLDYITATIGKICTCWIPPEYYARTMSVLGVVSWEISRNFPATFWEISSSLSRNIQKVKKFLTSTL